MHTFYNVSNLHYKRLCVGQPRGGVKGTYLCFVQRVGEVKGVWRHKQIAALGDLPVDLK